MRPASILFALLFLPLSGGAAQFQLSPQILAVGNGEHSQELTVSLLPSPNVQAAQVDVSFNLDQLGWVQVLRPLGATPNRNVHCELIGGRARAMIMTLDGSALPTMYAIPLCRVRVRPHTKTPRGNYHLLQQDPVAIRVDGTAIVPGTNSVRVIVD